MKKWIRNSYLIGITWTTLISTLMLIRGESLGLILGMAIIYIIITTATISLLNVWDVRQNRGKEGN